MRTLSVFVDESGDFGTYDPNSPYYLVSLVFHDQSSDILGKLEQQRQYNLIRGVPEYIVHAGPLIRRENEYREFGMEERRHIFNSLFHLLCSVDVRHHTIAVDKRKLRAHTDLNTNISKQLGAFLLENRTFFSAFDTVILYYDNGQEELTEILKSIFSATLTADFEFRKVSPANYKLFQVADMVCTFALLALKLETHTLSQSELSFFKGERELRKNYLKQIGRKRFSAK
jgi:hypothetical protein